VDLKWNPIGFAGSTGTVTVPATKLKHSFPVTIPSTIAPFAPVQGKLSASYLGTTVSTMLTIQPSETDGILLSFTLDPSTVVGGQASMATVTLVNAVTTPTIVGFMAFPVKEGSRPGAGPIPPSQFPPFHVPSAVTIPALTQSYSFPIPTEPPLGPLEYTISITANAFGGTGVAPLRVNPAAGS
jgi:hypothetical protein